MKQHEEQNVIRRSVREFVEWVVREGDIDNRRTGPDAETAMLLGANVHRKLQREAGGNYQAEVPLSFDFTLPREEGEDGEPVVLLLSGRADGIIRKTGTEPEHRSAEASAQLSFLTEAEAETEDPAEEPVTIDEIKGVFQPVAEMEAPVAVHLAQAECYAFIVLTNESLSSIGVRMTYVQLSEEEDRVRSNPDEIRRFAFRYTADEIRRKVSSYVEAYRKWAFFIVDHEKARNGSASGFPFPYDYRPGQKTIVSLSYRAIEQGKRLFVQAPTGIGKTLGVLYPAVRSVGEGNGEKIFYLTAKTVTGNVAESGMRLMIDRGLCFSYVKITAKEKLCPLDGKSCDPVRCERAKGHFSRVNDAIYDLITHESAAGTETLLNYAEKHTVCPYEFALDVSLFSDVVICDYNYAFDPRVYLRRYFAGDTQNDHIFLIDEAHNLAERAREMYSATLVKDDVLAAKKLVPNEKTLQGRLEKVNRVMLKLKRECAVTAVYPPDGFPNVLVKEVDAALEEFDRFFARNRGRTDLEPLLDSFFNLKRFSDTFKEMDDGYLPYGSFDGAGSFFVKLFCIDPSGPLMKRIAAARSAVFFSATLLPVRYFKRLLAGSEDEDAVYIDSPFDPENRAILIARDVSTKYTRRTESEYRRIASYLVEMASKKPGHYLAFFPSYQVMEETEKILSESADESVIALSDAPVKSIEILSQKRIMNEEERNAFLDRFLHETSKQGSLLGLSVMGGIFSEGIDLTGDALIGVAVVGTGIPQISEERALIKQHYDENSAGGYDYAYRFPGFNKVLQAAGRLIRTTEDVGVILLLDERFLERENRALFPREWNAVTTVNIDTVGRAIESFWNEKALM